MLRTHYDRTIIHAASDDPKRETVCGAIGRFSPTASLVSCPKCLSMATRCDHCDETGPNVTLRVGLGAAAESADPHLCDVCYNGCLENEVKRAEAKAGWDPNP
jgi:predicted RNA-binding Zn-ribbon protein involved in translation (DUF1610 family)